MREIKFRAWDRDNLIMHYSENDGEDSGEGAIYWYFAFGQPRFSEPQIVNHIISEAEDVDEKLEYKTPNQDIMQYTGLKDKQGKEIYEGDVVKYCYYVDYGQTGELKSCLTPVTVRWDKERAGFAPLGGWTGYAEQLRTCEVIGNIYENPELLKENK